mmetsp:Transcript_21612/g.3533  ORF Transcript_21612/g.3533 Transcript_21612/m.3533 type:complete len:81 (+) Transcript_21612:32-274(+)
MSIIGGVLLSLPVNLNFILYGRVTGFSSIMKTISTLNMSEGIDWKYPFFSSTIGITYLVFLITGNYFYIGDYKYYIFDDE